MAIDPVQLGIVGVALVVLHRALVALERIVLARRGKAADPVQPWSVTRDQCDAWRAKSESEIKELERRIMDKLDRIQRDIGSLRQEMTRSIRLHEMQYHRQDISGIHDIPA